MTPPSPGRWGTNKKTNKNTKRLVTGIGCIFTATCRAAVFCGAAAAQNLTAPGRLVFLSCWLRVSQLLLGSNLVFVCFELSIGWLKHAIQTHAKGISSRSSSSRATKRGCQDYCLENLLLGTGRSHFSSWSFERAKVSSSQFTSSCFQNRGLLKSG